MRNPTAKSLAAGVLTALCALAAPIVAHAQDWVGMATWQASFPTEDTQRFVDEASFRGVGLDFRKNLRGGTYASVMMAWNVFHHRSDKTYEFDTGAISGSQDHYINSFPIMLGVHQYFGKPRNTRLHVGLNAGGFILIQTVRIGVAEFEEDTWEWGLAPEAGVAIPIHVGAWMVVNTRYQWSPTSENLLGGDLALTYFQVNVGFMWEQ